MRIAIANASAAAVEVLKRVTSARPGYNVIWTASSGAEVIAKAARDKPDLILMDLLLPVVDGIQTTLTIMRENPVAILIVTDGISKNAAKVFEAMGVGALDAESTPTVDSQGNLKGGESLLRKVATIEKLLGKEGMKVRGDQSQRETSLITTRPMIAIGSSTGGPKALAEVLSRLPDKPGAPIVIVQHVDVQFARGLVDWLSGQTKLKVGVAEAGTRPEPDMIFVAGTNDHLVLTEDLSFKYVAEPRDNPYRPSVDVFFMSLLNYWPMKGVAALLTGMGRDGARGLLALRKAGWYTIAQDEATSVVYGMPKAAIELGAASEVLPIDRIAAAITREIKRSE